MSKLGNCLMNLYQIDYKEYENHGIETLGSIYRDPGQAKKGEKFQKS